VLSYHNTGHISWFTAAILYVANLKKDGLLPGPVVINFSIQIGPSFDVLEDAINFAIDQGILFVSIAGNWGPETPSMAFPGRLPQSISAGAVGWVQEGAADNWFFGDVPENDTSEAYVATFSGRPNFAMHERLDVLAPGSLVFGQWLAEAGYSVGRSQGRWGIIFNFIDGTSFAAPHVAGIVAQMLEKNPTLTQAQAEEILKSTALSVSPNSDGVSTALQIVAPWDFNATGAGLVRGTAALAVTP
jgi:subtilisin family serine protease